VPYQSFRSQDGFFCLAVGNDGQWRKLCQLLGTDWADDERFATNPARVENRAVIVPLLQEFFSTHETVFWLQALRGVGIPCGPLRTIEQVFNDPQVVARDMVWTAPHPTAGEVRLAASPLNLSETPVTYRLPPPLLGEHTEEILTSVLGYSSEEVEQLRAEGAV
jgi:crotonobetainyl-CoA:carnitine CoA-transferase CaiB-like acyl-CoA transferase